LKILYLKDYYLCYAGSLFERIKKRGHLTEMEASKIIRDLADALDFLHRKGMLNMCFWRGSSSWLRCA